MKTMALRSIFITLLLAAIGTFANVAVVPSLQTSTVLAAEKQECEPGPHFDACLEEAQCNARFLGFPAWYNGLTVKTTDTDKKVSCDIVSPNSEQAGGFAPFIWRIALNLIEMLLVAAGYAAVAFIIYGGYKYMISAGSADGMVAARKTILNAVIGLAISVAAIAIINTISGNFGIGVK